MAEATKYLDSNCLLYYDNKQKVKFDAKVDKVSGKGLSTNDYTTAEKNKLGGISAGAQANQNAFANIVVGSTTVAADSPTDTLTVTAGDNVTLTANATSDTLTITAKDTTYSAATGSVAGLMSAADKSKLDGVAAGANNYTHPAYTARAAGLNKVTVDAQGHVSAVADVIKADITALGIPAQDTTYSAATTAANGLMAAADKAKLDSFGAAGNYALKSDITNMYKYKGSVAAVANLPTTGNATGDVYNVEASGMNYAWNGTAWDALGEIFAIESITNAEIDAITA